MIRTMNITKALSDHNRVRVVMALAENHELCVCQITAFLEIAMATVSRHMNILQGADLVQSRKDGRWVYYRLSDSFDNHLMSWLKESLSRAPEIVTDRKTIKKTLKRNAEELCNSSQ